MGNCCGKSSDDGDNFTGPGRTLGGSNNAQAPSGSRARAPVPDRTTKPKPKVTGPGRTVGTSGGSSGDDPRSAAARAAEERVQKSQGQQRGKLGEQLAAQKKQTRADTLDQASRENQAAREAEASKQVRDYN